MDEVLILLHKIKSNSSSTVIRFNLALTLVFSHNTDVLNIINIDGCQIKCIFVEAQFVFPLSHKLYL